MQPLLGCRPAALGAGVPQQIWLLAAALRSGAARSWHSTAAADASSSWHEGPTDGTAPSSSNPTPRGGPVASSSAACRTSISSAGSTSSSSDACRALSGSEASSSGASAAGWPLRGFGLAAGGCALHRVSLPLQWHHQQQQQQQPPPQATGALQQQLQQWRAYRGAAKRARHPLPPDLAAALEAARAARPARAPALPPAPREMQFTSRRAGVIAVKAGMTQEWDEFGARVPLTVLWIDDCRVLRHKTAEADGSDALVLAAGSKKEKQLHPRQAGEYKAAGLPLGRTMWECPVTPDALLPSGTPITAAHFVAGQYLDVTGTTRGKGFAGVMKRWGFAGQPASHGNTKSHRRPGSIGGRTDPGKVWKGKKMPGHMGAETKTVKNVWLYKVDPARNLLYVRGQVPGPAGGMLLLRDAFRWHWPQRAALNLPFPTVPQPAGGAAAGDAAAAPAAGGVSVARRDSPDPYERYRSDVGEYAEGATWKTE